MRGLRSDGVTGYICCERETERESVCVFLYVCVSVSEEGKKREKKIATLVVREAHLKKKKDMGYLF